MNKGALNRDIIVRMIKLRKKAIKNGLTLCGRDEILAERDMGHEQYITKKNDRE